MCTHDRTPVVWRKSSRSFGGTECVEVAADDHRVLLRDSKLDSTAPILRSSTDSWRGFIADIKRQRFDH
jgi:hypothetical protein